MIAENTACEFSRPVAVDRLGRAETRLEVTASAAECAALAKRYGILSVDSLTAKLRLRRVSGSKMIRLKGEFSAQAVQACVISLEPVVERIEDQFEMLFGDSEPGEDMEVLVHFDEEDPPEPILHGMIDVGEAVAEFLALALTPFPRRPDAVFDPSLLASAPADIEAPEEPRKPNPFAALSSLKQKNA